MKTFTLFIVACFLALQGFSQCGTAPTSITATPTITTINGCYFTLTAVGGVLPAGGNYYWYMNSCGGQFLGTGITSPTLSVLSPTDYFVRIEAPCGNSVCASITVTTTSLAPPAVITANGPTTFCIPGSVVLSANTGAGLKYQWKGTAVGTISGATNSTLFVSSSNYGGIFCEVSYSPCWTTVSNTIYVTATPQPTGYISIPNTTMCPGAFNFLHLTASDYTYNIWQLNGVNLSGSVNMWELAPQTSGTYTCFISNACGSLTTNAITVNVLPTSASISTTNTHVCPGITTATLTANGGAGNSWQWRNNSTNIAGATNASYVATTSGNYDCVLSNNCGTYTSNSLTITSDAPPTDISPTGTVNLCSGSVTLFANSGAGLTRQWQRNGSNIAGATNYFYTVTSAGNYNCLVSNSCATLSTPVVIVIGSSPPSASITASGFAGYCAGTGSVTFTANTGTGITYQWYGSGQTLIPGATNSTYTTNVVGAYYVEETNACGSANSNFIQVPVPGAPLASISAIGATTICSGGMSQLQAGTAFGNSYQWRSNTVNISGATGTSYNATASGNYDCVVSNACGSNTSNSIAITVVTSVTASITAGGPTTFCQGGSVLLSANTGTSLTYQWRNNTTPISGATNSTYSATAASSYDCIVTNTCGSSTSNSISVTVNVTPTASIAAGGSTTFCSPGSVTLNANTGTGLTYQWRLNGSDIAGATLNSYVATSGGNYTCVVTNSCGSTTSNTISVTVNVAPTASITAGGPTSFCSGSTVTLSANAGTGYTYQWRLNGANISGATLISYLANAAGNYDCIVSNTCGSSTSNSISVIVNVAPTASITAGGSTTFCSPGSVTLNANTGTGLTYQWRKNAVNISGATASSYSANTAGSYDCIVSNTCGSSTSNSISVTVNVAPTATITAGGSTTFCSPGSVTLNANTGTGITYQWTLNGSNISGATLNSYIATSGGNYACVETNICGSTTSNTIAVTVNVAPTATISANGPTTFCSGGSVVLSANTGTGFTYIWKKNGTTISGATSSSYTATTAGSYTVVVSNSCGSATSSPITITIGGTAPAQPGTISGPATFCSGQAGVVYSIAAVAGATSYNWLVPMGAVITSGQGTTSITVTFGNKNGKIKVAAVNGCGTSSYASKNVNRNCRETAFEDEAEIEISIFPNPGSIFNLEVKNIDQPYSYELSYLTGVLIEKRDNLQPNTTIQLGENLSSGIYLVQIISGDDRRVLKLVKQ